MVSFKHLGGKARCFQMPSILSVNEITLKLDLLLLETKVIIEIGFHGSK